MANLSSEKKHELAAQLVIMDAIEKGHIATDEIIAYMGSEVFANAVKRYVALFTEQF